MGSCFTGVEIYGVKNTRFSDHPGHYGVITGGNLINGFKGIRIHQRQIVYSQQRLGAEDALTDRNEGIGIVFTIGNSALDREQRLRNGDGRLPFLI